MSYIGTKKMENKTSDITEVTALQPELLTNKHWKGNHFELHKNDRKW